MSEFTKGKWKIDCSSIVSYECRHIFIYPENLEFKQIDKDIHISLVNENYDECAANARLIAAAPEMYKALSHLLNEIPIIAGDSRHDALCEAICEAQTVIERIDGKEDFR